MPDLGRFDKPVVFLVLVTFGVVAMMSFMSWGFSSLGWSGPLSLIKGGTAHG